MTDQNRPDIATACSIVVQLIERDAPGLVGDHVLAVAQRLDGDGGPAVGHGGRDDHIDRRIAQQVLPGRPPTARRASVRRTSCATAALGVLELTPDQLATLVQ